MSEVRVHNSGGAHSKGNTNYSPNLTHTGGLLVCVRVGQCANCKFSTKMQQERE